MAAHSKVWYLERFRLLDVLTPEKKSYFAGRTIMKEIKRGERIYLPGDPSDQLFLLKLGVVRISAATGRGDGERILALLYPGDIFGELSVVDDSPRGHVATAHEDVIVCAIPRDALLRVIRETPELGYEITKLMGARLRRLESRVEELLFKSAQARIARAPARHGRLVRSSGSPRHCDSNPAQSARSRKPGWPCPRDGERGSSGVQGSGTRERRSAKHPNHRSGSAAIRGLTSLAKPGSRGNG